MLQMRFKFPSPLEVNRFISQRERAQVIRNEVFPSPLEVNRFISTLGAMVLLILGVGFRPLSR